jgi:hypothetical protein
MITSDDVTRSSFHPSEIVADDSKLGLEDHSYLFAFAYCINSYSGGRVLLQVLAAEISSLASMAALFTFENVTVTIYVP